MELLPLLAKACAVLQQELLLLQAQWARLAAAGEDALRRKELPADPLAGRSTDPQPSAPLLWEPPASVVAGLEPPGLPGPLAWEALVLQPVVVRVLSPPPWAQAV